MGNSPTFSGRQSTHIQQQNILLIQAAENSDYHVSKYQRYYDNQLLQLFESLRWKFNIALLFRPFSCLASCKCCCEWHQSIYRLTISELFFCAVIVTISISPIAWFINTFYTDAPVFEWTTNNIITKENGTYINSPGNIYGLPTSICFVTTFVLSARNTIWNIIFGLSLERAVTFHKYMARLSLIMSFIHFWEYRNYAWFKGQCLTGSITFLSAILITLTSFGIFRRKIWSIFLKLHWILFTTFLISGLLHNITYLYISLAVLSLDIFYRIYLIGGKPSKIKDIQLLPCNVIRIEFDKENFQFEAGQYVFICIPAIDFTQYHPFSISSSPHQKDSIMLHVRVLGDWTRKLYQFISVKYQENRNINSGFKRNTRINWQKLTMFVEGPYGKLQVPLHEYQSVIMISGGIGITPLQSIFNELLHNISHNSSPRYEGKREEFHDFVQRINFVWSVRDPYMVTEFGQRHWAGIQHQNKQRFKEYKNKSYDDIDEYKHCGFCRLPDFYSPDLLLVQQGTKMVQKTKVITQFYLTRISDQKRKENYSQQFKLLKFGRPNIEKIIKKAKQEFKLYQAKLDQQFEACSDYGSEGGCCVTQKRGKGICILVCGPISMIKTVEKYASKYNIDCHVEIFEF